MLLIPVLDTTISKPDTTDEVVQGSATGFQVWYTTYRLTMGPSVNLDHCYFPINTTIGRQCVSHLAPMGGIQ